VIAVAKIVIILGHPDPSPDRLCRALANAYADGARAGDHTVTMIDLAAVDVPMLHSAADWKQGRETLPDALSTFVTPCLEADHLVLVYPLWLGTMPAVLKAFLEQLLRPGVAFAMGGSGFPKGQLQGKSARVVVTMSMPAWAYRWYFFAHSLKNLERNILGFVGIKPIRETLYGSVETVSAAKRQAWLEQMRALGERAH